MALASPATFNVPCEACNRVFQMSVSILTQRKVCSFCGGKLRIPEDAAKAVAQKAAENSASKIKSNIAAPCPVCARQIWVRPEQIGKPMVCAFCTFPILCDEGGRVTVTPPPGKAVVLKQTCVGTVPCPACHLKKLKETNPEGTQVRCGACGHEPDLASMPLETFVDIRTPDAPLTAFIHSILRLRWNRREMGLGEVVWLLETLAVLDAWSSLTERPFSPFGPRLTAEILQHGVLCVQSAALDARDDQAELSIFARPGVAKEREGSRDGLVVGNAVGLGLLAVTGRGFIVTPGRGGEELEIESQPALVLQLEQSEGGSDLQIVRQDREGTRSPAGSALLKFVEGAIAESFPNATRQILAFKAVFGAWATGEMLYSLPPNALQRRIETFGGATATNAEALAKALNPQPAFSVNDLRLE